MYCNYKKWYFIIIALLIAEIESQNVSSAYIRFPGCSLSYFDGNSTIEGNAGRIISNDRIGQIKGYSGIVSIVGGSPEYSTEPYFAAITALKLGADHVQIFCYSTVGNFIKGFSPDIAVYPILDNAIDRMFPYLTKSDVVVLGPGLEKDAHSLNTVITRVINHCKLELKPLIIDVDEYFITTGFVNHFIKYPYPGIIITPNDKEFEKLYPLIKDPKVSTESLIQIDYKRFSDNLFILRKGCTDTGISSNPASSWSVSITGSSKRSTGQGHMMAGAVGIYYFWALNKLPLANITNDPMYKASVAAYAASTLIRECNSMSYKKLNRSMTTSDMVDRISCVIYDSCEMLY